MNKTIALVVFTLALAAGVWFFVSRKSKEPGQGVLMTTDAPMPIGPYSQAVVRGNAVFVSGQVAIDPKTGMADTSDIMHETRRVMDNIAAILKEAKMDMSQVVKTTIYVTDLKNFAAINNVYQTYFTRGIFPARETVQVAALPKKMHIEISVMAVR